MRASVAVRSPAKTYATSWSPCSSAATRSRRIRSSACRCRRSASGGAPRQRRRSAAFGSGRPVAARAAGSARSSGAGDRSSSIGRSGSRDAQSPSRGDRAAGDPHTLRPPSVRAGSRRNAPSRCLGSARRSDYVVATPAAQHLLHVLVADEACRHEFDRRWSSSRSDRLELVVAAARARALLVRDFVFGAHSFRLRTLGGLHAALRQSFLGSDRLARDARHLAALAPEADVGLLELRELVLDLLELIAQLVHLNQRQWNASAPVNGHDHSIERHASVLRQRHLEAALSIQAHPTSGWGSRWSTASWARAPICGRTCAGRRRPRRRSGPWGASGASRCSSGAAVPASELPFSFTRLRARDYARVSSGKPRS